MKKAILLIAALLMLGSLAFAEYSIGTWGRTVVQIAGGSTDPTTPSVYMGWGPNWWGNGPRMGVDMSWSSKVLSFKISTHYDGAFSNNGQSSAPAITAGSIDICNMYGSVKVIPNLLTLNVGYMNGDGFDEYRKNQPNPNSDLNNNLGRMAGWGVWLTLAPKDLGLSVTVNMMTPPPTGNGRWGAIFGGFDRSFDWANQIRNINVAASYVIPDIVKITAAFMNQYGGKGVTRVYDGTNLTNYEIYARFDVLAIQGMTLWLDGAFTGFETTNYNLQLDLGFGYKIGDLGLYLAGTSNVPLYGATPAITIGANLEVTYSLKPITLGLIVGSRFSTAAGANMQFEFQPYVGFDELSMRIAFDYELNTAAGTYNYWCVPIFFTFSF